jgi:hypothetical protein
MKEADDKTNLMRKLETGIFFFLVKVTVKFIRRGMGVGEERERNISCSPHREWEQRLLVTGIYTIRGKVTKYRMFSHQRTIKLIFVVIFIKYKKVSQYIIFFHKFFFNYWDRALQRLIIKLIVNKSIKLTTTERVRWPSGGLMKILLEYYLKMIQ